MSFVKILWFLILIAISVVPCKHMLHMFQQNRYETGRFSTWLKEHLFEELLRMRVPLIAAIVVRLVQWFTTDIVGYIVACLIGALVAIDMIINENRKNYIKPLVYTNRVKRQIAVMTVLMVLTIWVIVYRLPFLLGIDFLFVFLLAVIYIYPMAWITYPIEKAGQQKYLNEAKGILEQHHDLIKIGITGSYGKTTTKNVMQSVISKQYLSLMTPASFNTPMGITRTIREYLKPIHQVFVCEMGADHVGDITELMNFVHPSIGVVTSIGPQHLQTFGSQENIIKEKMQMIELLPSNGLGILNYDNEFIRSAKIHNNVSIKTYAIDYEEADYRALDIQYGAFGSRFTVHCTEGDYAFETKLLGKLNILNILSAIIAARFLNVEWSVIQKAVKEMKQVEHRLEYKQINGYMFIDDAFNANPSGAAMALDVLSSMPGKRYIVTPGMIDLGERQAEINRTFGSQMKDHADVVILVGEKQVQPIVDGLRDSGFDMNHVFTFATVKEAFHHIYTYATPADTILLENDLPDAFSH